MFIIFHYNMITSLLKLPPKGGGGVTLPKGDNKLNTWPVEMAKLINLQLLDLRGNQLSAWPVEMVRFKRK